MVHPVAAELVEHVGVRVEVQHADRPLAGERAQDRQRNGVVAADCDGHDIEGAELGEEGFDHRDRRVLAHRIHGRVPEVGHVAYLEGPNSARRVHAPDDPRGLAHSGRPLAGAAAVVESDVEGHADHRDVHFAARLATPGAHEGRDVRETRNHRRIHGPEVLVARHVRIHSSAAAAAGRPGRSPTRPTARIGTRGLYQALSSLTSPPVKRKVIAKSSSKRLPVGGTP